MSIINFDYCYRLLSNYYDPDQDGDINKFVDDRNELLCGLRIDLSNRKVI